MRRSCKESTRARWRSATLKSRKAPKQQAPKKQGSWQNVERNHGEYMSDAISFSYFLSPVPSGQERAVIGITRTGAQSAPYVVLLNTPEIRIECTSPECGGLRIFQCVANGNSSPLSPNSHYFTIMHWVCRNC